MPSLTAAAAGLGSRGVPEGRAFAIAAGVGAGFQGLVHLLTDDIHQALEDLLHVDVLLGTGLKELETWRCKVETTMRLPRSRTGLWHSSCLCSRPSFAFYSAVGPWLGVLASLSLSLIICKMGKTMLPLLLLLLVMIIELCSSSPGWTILRISLSQGSGYSSPSGMGCPVGMGCPQVATVQLQPNFCCPKRPAKADIYLKMEPRAGCNGARL